MPVIQKERTTACRCNRCRARRNLAKHPDAYIRSPKCECGGTFVVDSYREKGKRNKAIREKDVGKPCHCSGWWFIHRRGSKGCIHREDFIIESSLKGNMPFNNEDNPF